MELVMKAHTKEQKSTCISIVAESTNRVDPGGRAKIAVKKAAGAHNEPLSVNPPLVVLKGQLLVVVQRSQ
jgi:hypothetical protein